MGKIAGKVPKLQENFSIFRISVRSSTASFKVHIDLEKKISKKKEESARIPKDVYCYRYCFLETKERMHNEVGTCADILPNIEL